MCLYINLEVIACFIIRVLLADDMVYISQYLEFFLCTKIYIYNFIQKFFYLFHFLCCIYLFLDIL